MTSLKKIPFFLLLLPAFFCLHGSVENYGYVDLSEVWWIGIVITGYITAFFLITAIVTKNKLFAALITFFIALWYLFFGALHDGIKSIAWLHFMKSYSVLLPLLTVINVLYIWLLKRNKTFQPKLFFYLNALLFLYCMLDGILLVGKYTGDNSSKKSTSFIFDTAVVKTKPDIYYIVLDGYAGYKSLQDSFGFKNDSMYNYLQKNNFTILPSTANYDFTFYSMASTLKMEYIQGDFENKTATQKDIQQRFNEVRYAPVFTAFINMGYQIENYSFFDVNVKEGLYNRSNSFFPMHSFLLLNKIFHKRLLNDLGWMLHTGKFKIEWLTKGKIYRSDTYNNKAINMLHVSAVPPGKQPKFCYTHLLLPHEPYYKDSTGTYINLTSKSMYDKQLYVSYLKYTNSIVKSAVIKIIDKNPSAIIIIMSDHGFNLQRVRYYSAATFNNLCALRFPDQKKDTAISTISNVNIFRYLFNSQFNQKMPYLKDSTIWVKNFY